MVKFLSDEWIDALDRAAAGQPALDTAIAGRDVVIDYDVDGVRYHVAICDSRVCFRPGPSACPTITFVTDRATAAGIAKGVLNAQRAFLEGQLRVTGDVLSLTRAQALFATLPDVYALVREHTEF